MESDDPAAGEPASRRLLRGRIDYLGSDDTAVGEEHFELILQESGGTLRALCELNDVGVLRDMSMSFDAHWRPLDGFCRVTRHGVVVGSNWFDFGTDGVDVQSRVQGRGRISQCFENDPPWVYLGLHPLQGDAMVTTQADESRPGEYVAVRGLTNSVSENGDQDLFATPVSIEVASLGRESITVRAGRFSARKYALRWKPDWPPAYVWVREEDCVFLKLTWEQAPNYYELAELEERCVN